MNNNTSKTLAILGAGKLGTVIAQLALKAGYKVFIAGSDEPEKIRLSVNVLTPGATPVTAAEAINNSDITILALPLSKYKSLPVELLKNKLVIDAMNYWWEVDSTMPDLDISPSSSEMIQNYLPDSRIVKAFSHIGYHQLLDDSSTIGAADRKAIAIAGNHMEDNKLVANIVNDLGFDPVIIGDLSKGKILEPGNPLFGASVDAAAIRKLVI